MKISIETILRANAMGIARCKMKNNPYYQNMMQYPQAENKEIQELIRDNAKLKSAFQRARESVMGKNLAKDKYV